MLRNNEDGWGNFPLFQNIYCKCLIAFIVAFISLRVIIKNDMIGNYPFILGLLYPLLFEIKRKDIRNIILTLCLVAMYSSKSWIGFTCVGITHIVLFREYKIYIMSFVVLALLLGFTAHKMIKVSNMQTELINRQIMWRDTLDKKFSILKGAGFRAFSKLPENQPTARKDNKWLHTAHSDLLQGIYELGIVRMYFIMTFLAFTLLLIKSKPLLAGYLCLLFQACVDFPFHRAITGTFGLFLITLIYYEFLRRKDKCEYLLQLLSVSH